MQLPITHMLALAAFRFALTARAVPAGQTSPNTVDQASQIAKDNGVHAGAGANVPPQLKPYVPRAYGLPVHVAEGNTGKPAIPVQNYQNDVAQLPGADALAAHGSEGGGEQ